MELPVNQAIYLLSRDGHSLPNIYGAIMTVKFDSSKMHHGAHFIEFHMPGAPTVCHLRMPRNTGTGAKLCPISHTGDDSVSEILIAQK